MSAVHRLLPAVLAVSALAVTLPAQTSTQQAGGQETWITIERGVAQRALTGLAAAGRPGALVIVDAGRPEGLRLGASARDVVVARIQESDVALLSEILHFQLHHCGGFIWHPTREAAEKEAVRANDPSAQVAPEPPIPYTIDNGPVVQALMGQLQETNVRNTITALGAFFTRYHNCPSGLNSATSIRDTWQALTATMPGATVQFFNHTGYPTQQPSVILTIPGATLPSEVVVLGAHQDSIAGSNCSTSRAPGEDDDASGIASLTEVIRAAAALGYRPQRTVKFMAYAAEEIGLRGSAEIAQSFLNQGINVVGVMQLDMTNYKGSTQDIWIYTDFTNPTQNTFIGNLVDTYLPGLTRSTSACGYGCSDHASWNNRGYPASLPFEARFDQYNPFIHSSNDTISQSGGNANHALKFAKLAAAYLAEAAKGSFNNQPPQAAAGPDQVVRALARITLDGRGSFDPDNTPLTYSWTQVSGPSVRITTPHAAVAHFRPRPLDATYVLRLTVSDGIASDSDDVRVRFRPSEIP